MTAKALHCSMCCISAIFLRYLLSIPCYSYTIPHICYLLSTLCYSTNSPFHGQSGRGGHTAMLLTLNVYKYVIRIQ